MKKNLFWKVMAVLFFLWLCVWMWNSSIYISRPAGETVVKINKLTGTFYVWGGDGVGWQRLKKRSR